MSSSPPIADVRRPLAPRLLVSFIAAISLLLGGLAFAPANAADGVTVTGSIAAAGAESLFSAPIKLEVLQSDGGDDESWGYAESTYTDEDGVYTFSGVQPGTYRVTADGPALDGGSTPYAMADSANFPVGAVDVPVPVIALVLGAEISGSTSVDGESTTPVGDVRVIAYRLSENRYQSEREVTSDSDGGYTVEGLRDGAYRLGFTSYDYLDEYYNDLPTLESEGFVDIQITDGANVALDDTALVRASTLVGAVTNPSGEPLGGIPVSAYTEITDETGTYWGQSGLYDFTDEEGNYRVKVPAGVYRLGFDDYSGDYVPEFYNDKRMVTSAGVEEFDLSVGENAEANAELALGGRISGAVTGPGGDSIDSGCALVFREVDGSYVDESIDPGFMDNGIYVVDGLLPGKYKLRFEDCSGSRTYEPEYYDNVSTIEDATVITVVASEQVENIDGQLAERADSEPPVVTPPVINPPVVVPPTPPVLGPPAPVAKKAASISVSAKGAKKKATLTITVKAPGVTPTGKVTIKLGGKTLKNVTLKNGKAKVTLAKQKKGKRTYKVIYAGDSRVNAKTVNSKKVTIK